MAIDRKALFRSLSKGASKEAPEPDPIEGEEKPEDKDDGGASAGKQALAAIEANDPEAFEEAIRAILG